MVMWLMYIHHLDTFYKSYGSKNSPGVIWGHRGQKGWPRDKIWKQLQFKKKNNYVIL